MKALLLIFVGGGVGSVLRYLISLLLRTPYGTLTANILGCFAIGVFSQWFLSNGNTDVRLLLVTGLCGGFTTFSTFSNETIAMLRSGNTTMAFCYIAASLVLSVLATYLGTLVKVNS